jgi:sigma-B regulation protein RsbU (phosphoserine phosphatase)
MNPGDLLFLYTDGVPEATDNSQELFGNERMLRGLAESWNRENLQSHSGNAEQGDLQSSPRRWNYEDLQTFLTMFRRHVDDFVGEAPQFDDLTMRCLEFKKKYRKNPAGRKNRSWRRRGNMSKWIPEGYIQGGMKEKDWH